MTYNNLLGTLWPLLINYLDTPLNLMKADRQFYKKAKTFKFRVLIIPSKPKQKYLNRHILTRYPWEHIETNYRGDLTDRDLAKVPKLKHLSACGNKISDWGLCNMINLTYLKLTDSPMVTDNSLCYLKKLETLDLAGPTCKNLQRSTIRSLPKLKLLILFGPEIIVPSDFNEFPNLTVRLTY